MSVVSANTTTQECVINIIDSLNSVICKTRRILTVRNTMYIIRNMITTTKKSNINATSFFALIAHIIKESKYGEQSKRIDKERVFSQILSTLLEGKCIFFANHLRIKFTIFSLRSFPLQYERN